MIERSGNPVWTGGVTVLTLLAIAVMLWQSYLLLGL
jgi:hypothetical protein